MLFSQDWRSFSVLAFAHVDAPLGLGLVAHCNHWPLQVSVPDKGLKCISLPKLDPTALSFRLCLYLLLNELRVGASPVTIPRPREE